MEKMQMKSADITEKNIEKILELFPNVATEDLDENGNLRRRIDFELLKDELGGGGIDEKQERYTFTWPGKKQSILEARKPITKTLRPDRQSSKDWEKTKNIYIEGDNLEALKLLQETYLGKIKMIYIDPPYNTGNDFIYKDDFSENKDSYEKKNGNKDEDGNRLVQNPESNGRFHSDWCSMIYLRLKFARNLLSKDGVIFISIDDNEQANLKKICDEVFGEDNFVANIVWKRKRGRDNSAKWFSKAHEYCLVYSKNKSFFDIDCLEMDEETRKAYKNPDNDPRGDYRMLGCWARGTQGGVKYDFTTKSGQYFKERLWLFSKDNLSKLDSEDKLIIHGDNIYRKMFLYENKGKIPETLWDDVSNAANASDEIKSLFSNIVFETPKPIPYIKRMIKIAKLNPDSIILDFFSGSATTAHAVMQLNAEDGGNRRFILVQVPEKCAPESEAFKAGYKTICDIGKERIRRAGNKIQEENKEKDIDIGFRVFKVDETNMKDVYYEPTEYDMNQLEFYANNIKQDRTEEDLLFQVMLEFGIELSAKIEEKEIAGKRVFIVENNFLIACFDSDITEETVTEIAKKHPFHAVFRDSGIATDSLMANFEQIFKSHSPETQWKVL